MDLNQLASDLFGSKRAESGTTPSTVSVMYGIATSDSADGMVSVWLSDNAVSPSDAQTEWDTVDSYAADAYEGMGESTSIEIPTEVTCFKDDVVRVQLVGAGAAKNPTVVGVVGRGDEQNQRLGSIEADYVKATELEADVAQIGFLKADSAVIGDLKADTAKIHELTADELSAATAFIADLKASNITAQTLTADVAKVHDLTADQLSAAAAYIAALKANSIEAQNITAMYGDFDTVKANAAKVANLTAQELEADHATIASLDSNYAHITNGVIDNAKINYAKVEALSAHYAEIQNGHINSALIDTAAIVDEQVFTVTGNKATISEINADNITVRNLHTSNLTVDTADGYVTIGNKQTPTKEFLDSLKDELQQEIDGAVETFTSSAVPLLSNYPASDWVISGATEEEQRKAYAKHVGDICYVQNSALDQNGYAYRFAYDSTEQTFKWVLIKDSDVTKALGDISDLKEFESDTTSWINETDEGLRTIRQNHTALSGVVDKTVVETKQLWFTKANTTAPSKPNSTTFPDGVTSTSTAGNAWRVVVPAYNASYPNYYYCLQYKLVDGTFAWSDVVRDIAMGESQQQGRKGVADAATADGKAVAAQNTADANIKSSVQLWFTKADTTAPDKPTAQVTVNDATKTNQWNLAIPTYSSSYPHYFYCYQQQKGDGTWQWTDVVYDRSISEAQAKAQAALPSSEFTTFKTTTFKEVVDEVDEQSSTITTLSEKVQTTARNLLLGTVSPDVIDETWTIDNQRSNPSSIYRWSSAPYGSLSKIAGAFRLDYTGSGNSGFVVPLVADNAVIAGETVTVSFTYRTNHTTSGILYFINSPSPNSSQSISVALTGDEEWHEAKKAFTVVRTSNDAVAMLLGYMKPSGKYLEIKDGTLLLEHGDTVFASSGTVNTLSNTVNEVKQTADSNNAYITNLTQTLGIDSDGKQSSSTKYKYNQLDQTLDGITTRVGKTESTLETVSNPNLTPWFSVSVDDTSYWNSLHCRNTSITNSEGLHGIWDREEGWAHITLDARTSAGNNGSKSCYMNMHVAKGQIQKMVEPGGKYTWMVEVRNLTWVGASSSSRLYVYPSVNNATLDVFSQMPSKDAPEGGRFTADGIAYGVVTAKSDFSSLTLDTRGYCYIPTGCYADFDLRVSLYEGEYSGPYKPFVEQSLSNRVKSAETAIEQNAEDITLRATKAEVQSLGGNLLTDTDNPVLGSNIAPKYAIVSGGNGTGTIATVTDSPLPNYEKAFRITGNTSGNRDFAQSVGVVYGQKYLFTAYARGIGGEAKALIRVYSGSELFIYTTVVGTDWTPIRTIVTLASAGTAAYKFFQFGLTGAGSIEYIAPCLSGGAAANTAAELKVANDNINLKVSKNDVINQINVSTEGVTIDAERVNIEGAAIFTSNGRLSQTSLNNAYDAKGAASTAISNLQIGGRNLFTWPLGGTKWKDEEHALTTYQNRGSFTQFTGSLLFDPSETVGEQYTISFWAKSPNGTTSLLIYNQNGTPKYFWFPTETLTTALGDEWEFFSLTVTNTEYSGGNTPSTNETYWRRIELYAPAATGVLVKKIKVERGNKATDWSPAPEDSVSISERIYYRSNSSTKPSAPTAWVADATSNTYNAWTTKVPPLAVNTNEGSIKYPYLYTCEQRKAVSGAFLGCTAVQLDENTTVIDGGNIITNSIEAEKIKANSLTLGQISTTAQADILNSKVVVGGRNLLLRTASGFTWDINTTSYGTHHLYSTGSSDTAYDGPKLGELGLTVGDDVTLSFDWATKQYGSNAIRYGTFWAEFYGVKADGTNGYTAKFGPTITMSASNASGHYSQKMTLTSLTINTLRMVMRSDNSCLTFAISNVKLEKGNKESSWTPAPEDQEASVASVQDEVTQISNDQATMETNIGQIRQDMAGLASNDSVLALQEKTSWLRFVPDGDGRGLTIGDSDGFNLKETGQRLEFNYNDQTLASASGNVFDAPNMSTSNMMIGNYAFVPVDDDGIALVYIGGE